MIRCLLKGGQEGGGGCICAPSPSPQPAPAQEQAHGLQSPFSFVTPASRRERRSWLQGLLCDPCNRLVRLSWAHVRWLQHAV